MDQVIKTMLFPPRANPGPDIMMRMFWIMLSFVAFTLPLTLVWSTMHRVMLEQADSNKVLIGLMLKVAQMQGTETCTL